MAITQTLSKGLKREFEVVITNSEINKNTGQEIAKIISDESRKIMPAPRVYNGVLPSSSYPGFNTSRVNLIN